MSLEKILRGATKLFLCLLPWHTVWIIQERVLNGSKWQYGTIQFFITEAVLWFTIVLFMLWYKRQSRGGTPTHWFSLDRIFLSSILLFIIYTLSTRFFALSSDIAVQYGLYMVEALCLFFVLTFGPLQLHESLEWFVYGSIVPALLGISQFITQTTFASTLFGLSVHDRLIPGTSILETVAVSRLLRAYGSFTHPNAFGGYLFFVCVALVGFYVTQKERIASYKNALVGAAGGLALGALFFTFSRSAWVSFCIFFVGVVLYSFKRKKYTVQKICSIAFIILCALVMTYRGFVISRFTFNNIHEQTSVEERIGGYGEAWKLFKQYTVLGTGPGNYTAALYVADPEQPGYVYQPVHNVYVLFLVEWGLIGTLLLINMKLWYLVVFRKYVWNNKTKVVLMVVSILPIALLDHYLISSYVGILLTGIFSGLLTRYIAVHK